MSRHLSFLPLRVVAIIGILTIGAALLSLTPEATAATACPDPLPVAEIKARLAGGEVIEGVGYTVSRGGTPEPFDVEILGVQSHWFLPGRSIIIVDTDSPAIRSAGGIWAGMSGSPVYATDGRLIGGLAWGFSFGPSRLAGLTPAQEMLDLLAYPPGGGSAASASVPGAAGTVTGGLATVVRERDAGAGTRLEPLPLPVPLPDARATAFAQERFDRVTPGLRAVPGSTGSASGTADFVEPQAGGNFAAAFSYGDNAYYASGTTTFVCDGFAVAFAHWFDAAGATSMGANDGNAIAIVDDPTFGPYKLMNLATPVGLLDQDRFAGVRAILGVAPPTSGVRTAITDLDTGRTTAGATDVVYRPLFSVIAALHLWDAVDTTIDRWGRGTAALSWTVAGTREGGAPWSFSRENMFASDWDIGYTSIFELEELLWSLQLNDLEAVTLDEVTITGSFEQAVRRTRVVNVRASIDGDGFEPVDQGLVVRPGSTLDLSVTLLGLPDVELFLQVPHDAGDFVFLRVHGGEVDSYDAYNGDGGTPITSFDELLEHLVSLPQGNEVIAELVTAEYYDEPFPDDPFPEPGASSFDAAAGDVDRTTIDRVVTGEVFAELFVDHDDGNGNGPPEPVERTVQRVYGADRIETAIAVSQQRYPDGTEEGVAVIARADDYADALSGAPLASELDAPLLLTHRGTLPPLVSEELTRLGITDAVLLGGPAAISEEVVSQLERDGLAVERIAGGDRFATAARIAGRLGGDRAYLALGTHPQPNRGWPDALAVSALAGAGGNPILLTAHQTLPTTTVQALADLNISDLVVVGGTAAIDDAVLTAAAAPGRSVERLAGRTRYETSMAIAERAIEHGAAGGRVWLATGRNFPDALSAGPAVVADGGILLLVDGMRLDGSPPVMAWLDELGADLEHVTLIGGPVAISADVEDALRAHVTALDGIVDDVPYP